MLSPLWSMPTNPHMPIPFKDALFKLKNSAITISQHPVDGISNSQGSKAWVYFAGICMALASVYLYIRERTFKGSNFKTSDFRTYFTCLIQWFRSEKKWLFLFLAILFLVYLSAFLYPYLLTDETWLVRPGTHIGLGHGFGRYLVPENQGSWL